MLLFEQGADPPLNFPGVAAQVRRLLGNPLFHSLILRFFSLYSRFFQLVLRLADLSVVAGGDGITAFSDSRAYIVLQ